MSDPFQGAMHTLPFDLGSRVQSGVQLAKFSTLHLGGAADLYVPVYTANEFAQVCTAAQKYEVPHFILGGGSNICISDAGIRGLVIHNLASECTVAPTCTVDCGYPFMRLFLSAAAASLSGLEFAVGIPGTVGGALVSNAGAYRSNICDIVQSLRVVEAGEDRTVTPDWMEFSYRDSRLRRADSASTALISVTLGLTPRPRSQILAVARENQRQRIYKQPWNPSAGSFFKNVTDTALAASLPGLTDGMRKAGVVPAGLLSAAAGCAGLRVGAAQMSLRHANILINRGGARASDVRILTSRVKRRVYDKFGIDLCEEVLFVGDWGNTPSSDVAVG